MAGHTLTAAQVPIGRFALGEGLRLRVAGEVMPEDAAAVLRPIALPTWFEILRNGSSSS